MQHDQWFYAQNGHQYGPVTWSELREMATAAQLDPGDLVWQPGMPDWMAANRVAGLAAPPPPAPPPPPTYAPQFGGRTAAEYRSPGDPPDVNRIATGVLAVLLGCLGVHKFMLGRSTQGHVLLWVTVCSCFFGAMITAPIGIVEGILYLTKSDEEFYRTYVKGRREWF